MIHVKNHGRQPWRPTTKTRSKNLADNDAELAQKLNQHQKNQLETLRRREELRAQPYPKLQDDHPEISSRRKQQQHLSRCHGGAPAAEPEIQDQTWCAHCVGDQDPRHKMLRAHG